MSMTIAAAAQAAGVGVETIRFYERRGLIKQPPKPNGGGFRVYSTDTIARIRFIRQAQELGFSLRQIDELLNLRADPRADAASVRARAAAKLDEVDAKIRHLRKIRRALNTLIAACPGKGALGCCSIMEALAGSANTRMGGRRSKKTNEADALGHRARRLTPRSFKERKETP
jgi:MerR family mercuric resistance operon transcriptional regulator